MSRHPKKSDTEIAVEKSLVRDAAKRTRQLRERISQGFHFDAEAEALQKSLTSKAPEDREKQDSSMAPNFPKGMRVVDYNAMREAEVLRNVNEQIQRGSYTGGSRGETCYAEPAVPFHIPMDRVPGETVDLRGGLVPAKWSKGKTKRERNMKAAKERAAKYKEEAEHGQNGNTDGRRSVDVPEPAIRCPHGIVARWRKDDKWYHSPCGECQKIFLKTCNLCPEKDRPIGRMVGTRCDSCPYEFVKSLFGPAYETGLSKWMFPL